MKQTSLKLRELRDLAWILDQRSIFSNIPDIDPDVLSLDFLAETNSEWLKKIEEKPQSFLGHVSQRRSSRLGIYFEQLLSFYFQYCPVQGQSLTNVCTQYKLNAENLQVHRRARTLGEFDFIITNQQTNKIYHIEVALKFYLGYDDASIPAIKGNRPRYNWHRWVGPGGKDTLAIKLKHLFQHQLVLSQSPIGKKTLENLGIDATKLQHRLWYCGYFYFPVKHIVSAPKYSQGVTVKHYWIKLSNLALLENWIDKNHHTLCFLPRNYWLSEVTEEEVANQLSEVRSGELIEFLSSNELQKHSQWQFAEMASADPKHKHECREIRRWFVIKDY